MRIGQGYDAHRFELGKPLVLGGASIPSDVGLKAHSDGDVLIHAICDALLGAVAMGDIGYHFSDQDDQYHNVDSRLLLRQVTQMLDEKGWQIINVDSTVVAQKPRLSAHIQNMRAALAECMSLPIDAVSVKATTTEKMGFTGREEGIAAQAIALLDAK